METDPRTGATRSAEFLALNPNNAQATSELNLLFRRELDSGKSDFSVEIQLGGLGKLVAICLLTFAGLYAGAMHIPGGLKLWPDQGIRLGPEVFARDGGRKAVTGR